jgi:DNA-binding NtrC family response regulator
MARVDSPRLPASTRILVVDDGDAIRVLMRKYLEMMGYHDVRLADSVEMGLQAFREHGSELVFLDVMIGDQKGIDFALPALADRPETTIVVMTAHPGTHQDVTNLVAQGARDYLPKPIQSSRLRETLDRIAEDLDGTEDDTDEKVSVDTSYG